MKSENSSENKLKKTMICLYDNIIISAYDIHTIEKEIRFFEKPKAHFEYGIILNKNLEENQYVTKSNIDCWFLKEEVRDKYWNELKKELGEKGLKILEITI